MRLLDRDKFDDDNDGDVDYAEAIASGVEQPAIKYLTVSLCNRHKMNSVPGGVLYAGESFIDDCGQ
jgi:hypothetical protein